MTRFASVTHFASRRHIDLEMKKRGSGRGEGDKILPKSLRSIDRYRAISFPRTSCIDNPPSRYRRVASREGHAHIISKKRRFGTSTRCQLSAETTTRRRRRPRGIPIVRAVNEFVPARDTRAQSLVVSRSLSATRRRLRRRRRRRRQR